MYRLCIFEPATPGARCPLPVGYVFGFGGIAAAQNAWPEAACALMVYVQKMPVHQI